MTATVALPKVDLFQDQGTQEEDFHQFERLAAVGQMVVSVSHETRNERFILKGALSFLEEEVQDHPNIGEWIGEMQQSCHRLERLLEDVRGFVTLPRLERTFCPLYVAWQNAWSQLERQWKGRQVQFEQPSPCRRAIANVDSFRMEQVFRNLFENSLQACRDPVCITIACTDTFLDGEQAVRISVRDNGPGLAEQQRQQVFAPFFTTKHKGTGLGMAIVKQIVEGHGGMIHVGDCSQGAEFVITLPVGIS